MTLFVSARRAFISKGGMAPSTKPRDVADFAAALRALHRLILVVAQCLVVLGAHRCAEVVNTGYSYRARIREIRRVPTDPATKRSGNATELIRSHGSTRLATRFGADSLRACG